MSRWPQERLVRTRVVSGFIFLRLLCPAILNPRHFNLIAETPSHNASRSLIMVAKCLQNLANLVEFGGKEPYMEVVNPFILKNKERMVYYLDQLSVSVIIQCWIDPHSFNQSCNLLLNVEYQRKTWVGRVHSKRRSSPRFGYSTSHLCNPLERTSHFG